MSEKPKPMRIDDTIKRVFRDYAEALLFALVIAILLRLFVVSAYKIPTSSMAPNLRVGDFIIALNWPFGFKIPGVRGSVLGFEMPKRGDTVVFTCPSKPTINCIKRVVALPGDRVQLVKKNLILNNKIASYQTVDEVELSPLETTGPYAILRENIGGHQRNITIQNKESIENFGPIVVPPGHFFVLADFRDSSEDSRLWGAIPVSSLKAEAYLIWMSMDWSEAWQKGGWPKVRWNRLLKLIK